jgi:hypothetical protein
MVWDFFTVRYNICFSVSEKCAASILRVAGLGSGEFHLPEIYLFIPNVGRKVAVTVFDSLAII